MGLLSYQIIRGQISIGSFVGLLTAAVYLRIYLSSFFDYYKQLHELNLYREQIEAFFKLESPIETSDASLPPPTAAYAVDIRNLNFTYPASGFKLDNLNMAIEKGKKVAIVGYNGAGKSTLIKLLLHLYNPDSGQILINSTPIEEYDLKKYRYSVGTAFQDSPTYALTMRENMSLYETTDDASLTVLAQEYGLDKVLRKSNGTLDSVLTREFDNDGIILSGGEIQKLALSRLQVKDFGLLILDEPTSALDPLAKYELNQKIFHTSNKTTTLIVTHRLTTAKNADYIYVFDNGCIVEQGNHSELIKQNGLYAEMFSKQAENYIE